MTDFEPTTFLHAPSTAMRVRDHAASTLASNDCFRLHLLFDAACHPDGLKTIQEYATATGAELHNLLEDLPEGDAQEVGCYLVTIYPDQAENVFAYWAAPDQQPAAVWLWTTGDTGKLAAHFRRFVLVKYGSNESGLLRIADPHVWRALTIELEDSIGYELTAPLGAWWITDLDGDWKTTRVIRRKEEIRAAPLALTTKQVAKLEDAMWPVQIYFAMYQELNEQPALGQRMAKLKAIRQEYEKAKDWGGRDAQDYVMFSSLANEFGADFDTSPNIFSQLQAGKVREQKLATTLRSIAPSVWNTL